MKNIYYKIWQFSCPFQLENKTKKLPCINESHDWSCHRDVVDSPPPPQISTLLLCRLPLLILQVKNQACFHVEGCGGVCQILSLGSFLALGWALNVPRTVSHGGTKWSFVRVWLKKIVLGIGIVPSRFL